MGRHQSAASSRRARVALGALPLVATVGAIGVGSVVMSPASSDAPLGPPSVGGGAGAPATALPLGPGLAPAPVTVLDLAATDGSVAPQGVPGATIGGVRPGSGGSRGDDAPASGRATRSGATAGGGEVARVSSIRDVGTPGPRRRVGRRLHGLRVRRRWWRRCGRRRLRRRVGRFRGIGPVRRRAPAVAAADDGGGQGGVAAAACSAASWAASARPCTARRRCCPSAAATTPTESDSVLSFGS